MQTLLGRGVSGRRYRGKQTAEFALPFWARDVPVYFLELTAPLLWRKRREVVDQLTQSIMIGAAQHGRYSAAIGTASECGFALYRSMRFSISPR